MQTVAVIHADLTTSPIGTAGHLSDELCGVAVLRRTVQRTAAAKHVGGIVLTCPTEQFDAVSRLADSPDVTVRPFDGPDFPLRKSVQTARKWSLQSWRGGMAGTCFFDEHANPALLSAIAEQLKPDVLVSVAAEAPLIDPLLIDTMIEHYARTEEDMPLIFAQSPPGLSPAIYRPDFLADLVKSGLAPGWSNTYRPDQPRRDQVSSPMCYRPPLAVLHGHGRLTSDTRRGFERLQQLVQELGEDTSAEQVCTFLASMQREQPEPFPREIQIELTTEDQHHNTTLRPRGAAAGNRGPITLDLFRKVVSESTQYDDVVVVLGGFGEPLLHPQFGDLLGICQEVGVFGLAIRTNGIAMSTDTIGALLESRVDVVQLLLDSLSAESYRKVHGCDSYRTVMKNVEQFQTTRESRKQVLPMLLGSLVKAKNTFDELEPFYDQWLRRSGWVVIEGYSHHARQLEDRCVMSMAPPRRLPCRQLRDRLTVLASGQVVGCDQDFRGAYVIGNVADQSLAELWSSANMQQLRTAHQQENYSVHPMCETCDEWHRP